MTGVSNEFAAIVTTEGVVFPYPLEVTGVSNEDDVTMDISANNVFPSPLEVTGVSNRKQST